MSNYIGVRCPVCNKKFVEADDIVVCPVCGAPHHRDCYAAAGQCAFAQDHLSGKEWSDPAGQVPPHEAKEDGTRACPRCGSANPPESIFCQVCGNPFAFQKQPGAQPHESGGPQGFPFQVNTISMAYGGLSPDDEIEGETVRDLACYVGSGSAYYLPRFRLMSSNHRVLSPNFAALFFTFLYYFYRKMYLIGALMLVLYVVSNVPAYLYTWEVLPQMLYNFGLGPAVEVNVAQIDHLVRLNNITRTIHFFIGLVMSLFANRAYYLRTISAVHDIRTGPGAGKEPQEYSKLLSKAGGANKAVVIIVLSIMVALLLLTSFVMIHMSVL